MILSRKKRSVTVVRKVVAKAYSLWDHGTSKSRAKCYDADKPSGPQMGL